MKKSIAGQLAQEMHGERAAKKYYSAKQIAEAMQIGTRNVQRRATKENWSHIKEKGIGGTRKLFGPQEALPPDVRRAVEAWEVGAVVSGQLSVASGAPLTPALSPGGRGGLPTTISNNRLQQVTVRNDKQQQITIRNDRQHQVKLHGLAGGTPALPDLLPEKKMQQALARAELVKQYLEYANTKRNGGGVLGAKRDFLTAYNLGIAGLCPQLFRLLEDVTFSTIERWVRTAKKAADPVTALASRHGEHLKGKHLLGGPRKEFEDFLTDAQGKILLAFALNPNKYNKAEIIYRARIAMQVRGIPNALADETYRRFLDDFEARCNHIWVYSREGKQAWNDQCAFFIRRDHELLDVGDCLVADGHTFNFESINPYTGKPKRLTLITFMDMKSNFPCGWEIMPTENTQAIAAALRRAILTLGKMPLCVYIDNGLAFGAKYFNGDLKESGLGGLFKRLGIEVIYAWPYHGQSKTVERWHKTLKSFEKQAATYVGGNIEEKPPHRKMGEKAHRRMWERMTGGFVPTLLQTHQALALWLDEDYNPRPQPRGHLQGKSPLEVFEAGRGPGVDAAELRFLMLSATVRTIHRRGVTHQGREYWAPELYGRKHQAVVRYDLQDPDAVLVYDLDGEFICEARTMPEVHPIARIKGDEEDLARLQEQIAIKKNQEKQASVICRTLARDVVAPETQAHFGRLGLSAEGAPALPPPPPPVDLEEVRRQVEATTVLSRGEPEEELVIPKAIDEVELACQGLEDLPEWERYEELLKLEARYGRLPTRQKFFLRYFEMTDYWQASQEHYEALRTRLSEGAEAAP